MDGTEPRPDNARLQKFPKLPLWIIEYVWAHKMMEIQEVVDPSRWPEVDSQPLSLEDSWRLRVSSAQIYSIVKNRDMEHFERGMDFLEAAHRLLPRLVAPIKHMKIMFGLKTMVIMRMLREGRGMVNTVLKTSQFFPAKLPQYQGQCSQREMFLMRKNHLDFKALAQALAVDKNKLEDYIKILKKESPVTEEEKLLLEVITSDSVNIATTLKKLLHCDVASCRLGSISQSSAYRSSEALLNSPLQFQPEVCRGGQEADQEGDGEVVRWSEEDGSDEEKEELGLRSGEDVQEAPSSPQFCSKHRRWVRSILQECPDECSEELLQANDSSSPPLFQSSSSATSSQDLTPSDIVPCPPDQRHPLSQTSTRLQTAVQASEQANPEDEQRSRSPGSASDASQTELLLSSRDTRLPVLWSPVVRLIDIASVGRIYPVVSVSSNKQTAAALSPQALTSPRRHTLGNTAIPLGTMKDTTIDQPHTVATTPPNTTCKVKTVPLSQVGSTSCQPPPRQSLSKLSRKFRRARTTTRHSQALDGLSQNPLPERILEAPTTFWTSCPAFSVSGPPIEDASNSTPQLETLSSDCAANHISLSTESSRQVVPRSSVKPLGGTHSIGLFESKTRGRGGRCSTAVSPASNSDCLAVTSETCRIRRAQLKLSLPSQALLLQSKLLQPYVSLNRLSAQDCYRVTKPRSSIGCVEAVAQAGSDDEDEEEEEDADSSFDVNTLYSGDSSSGDSEDAFHCDPEYKPRFKKRRLLSE
ncbi:uncharacterized protein [Cebidichthys violaceus]|uniref:uncharacterized protein isoform X2 n=1 Tax=Cebidichthys violaceus TaxID=271503 RepID=UPI0035CA6085